MEQLAERFWGSLGSAALPGLSETEFDAGSGDATVLGARSRASSPHIHVVMPGKRNYFSFGRAQDYTSTVDTSKGRIPTAQGQPKRRVFSWILHDEGGEGITTAMRIDAIRFLSRFPSGIAMPTVEFGVEEITFEWRFQDMAATASVEGDGLVGYALKYDGRFMPGEGPECLSAAGTPADLLDYLKDFPTD